MNSYLDVIAAYDDQADLLAERYEAVSSERMLAAVVFLVRSEVSVLDLDC